MFRYLSTRVLATGAVLAGLVVAFSAGVYFGANNILGADSVLGVVNSKQQVADADFDVFWKAWNLLNERYVPGPDKKPPTNEEKVYGAIQGLAGSYKDPYTVFFPPVESKSFQEEISGNFEGVGMEIGIRDDVLTVVSPLKGSPAEKAGIQPGDKILKIADTVTAGMKVDEAVKLIRGKKGTSVSLTLLRKGKKEPFSLSVLRDVINIPTITTEKKEGVFIVHLYNFSAQSPNLFRDALREFVRSGSNKLVLDLRGNPGGYLEAAVDMASWFLPAGKVIVREDYGGGRHEDVYRSKGYDIFSKNLQMVILVNEGSASASEILSGALSEHGIATLVGTKTFGKGSVQELLPVTDKTSLKITIARWLTPNGKSISDNGITPDVVVDVTPEDVAKAKDAQLEKAIEILNR